MCAIFSLMIMIIMMCLKWLISPMGLGDYVLCYHFVYVTLSQVTIIKILLCYVMLCYVMPCYVMLCHAMPCHAMPCHVMSCHVMSCHVMLCPWYITGAVVVSLNRALILFNTFCAITTHIFLQYLDCELINRWSQSPWPLSLGRSQDKPLHIVLAVIHAVYRGYTPLQSNLGYALNLAYMKRTFSLEKSALITPKIWLGVIGFFYFEQ